MFNQKNKGSKHHVSINYGEIPPEDDDTTYYYSFARTLDPSYLGYHWASGWDIQGPTYDTVTQWDGSDLKYDFEWVNEFRAYNRITGDWVRGDFEGIIYASSRRAVEEFLLEFPYREWDYDPDGPDQRWDTDY